MSEKLVGLLDYVEQVVKLDERVAFRLADYRLADGTALAILEADTRDSPGVSHEGRDEDGAVWLSVDRLSRREPPRPPEPLAAWLNVHPDPGTRPDIIAERLETVTATERNALLASEAAIVEDFDPVPERPDDIGQPPRFDLKLRLGESSQTRAEIEAWIDGPWLAWAEEERVRRRTIAIYAKLYKLQQQLELGGADGAVEAVWGIGLVRWSRGGRRIERPLIERFVEIELEDDGTIRVRPRDVDARVDLKPYEEFDCPNLNLLDDIIRREIARAGEDEGVGPYRRDTFEPILAAAATRLASNGTYAPGQAASDPAEHDADGPLITDEWTLFARPRSQHVVLDDIARFRTLAREGVSIQGLAERLVTPPSADNGGIWTPLSDQLGGVGSDEGTVAEDPATDVFFPKPFNEDQIAIVRRLAQGDGLVVQGPPGTGKTHTIANLICHALALGQRVLVLSRGEAALAVLRDQLPEKVRPLTISLLSSERQGLRQVETAIREIQAVVEESRPEIRMSAIRRCEAEIVKIRGRLIAIDGELDRIAERQTAPVGPKAESPADLARRLSALREAHAWFTDRPDAFSTETDLSDADLQALAKARHAAGEFLDHLGARPPSPADMPETRHVANWHEDLVRAASLAQDSAMGPAHAVRIAADQIEPAATCARTLRDLASARDAVDRRPWLAPVLGPALAQQGTAWLVALRDIASAFWTSEAERARLVPKAVDVPEAVLDDPVARGAIARAAVGERLWPRLSLGRSASKDLVASVLVRGASPGEDRDAWQAVQGQIELLDTRLALGARWRAFARELGASAEADPGSLQAIAHYLIVLDTARTALSFAEGVARNTPPLEAVAMDPGLARALAAQLDAAVASARLATADAARLTAAALFSGKDRTSAMVRQFFERVVGREGIDTARIEALWESLEARVAKLRAAAGSLAAVESLCDSIAAAGAPEWAQRLRSEPPTLDHDALIPDDWRAAWDSGAAEAHLGRMDGRDVLMALARERDAADRRGRKLFVELVRERAFHALERRLSPRVKSALVEYVRALGRLGKGTGKGAGRHRRAARDAMARCYDAVPCWIMPTWRVAEQLPSDLAAFDLVILDEASQSDVTEIPALLRGRKILAVGDDRQVSPTAPFVTQAKIEQLRHHFLQDLPYGSLLEPGESLYDLMRAVFPDSRLMLKEHFRCVEPIIRFSMQFYPEKLIPLRIPSAQERLDPPLIDIFVPHGLRDGARKINRPEAEIIVDEIARMIEDPAHRHRSIGVISLIGAEQAELVRVMLSDRIGEEAMQRHAILCGDSATFQGNERDVVFLSMVADRRRRTTLTMLRYEQRFNVAASRARDRLVLVRSVALDELNPNDLKAKLIAHFAEPMPSRPVDAEDLLVACESEFERDLMRRLLDLGYQVEPQIGAQGFRIDLVVEGAEGRRLAIECDGDSFHGPQQWREDMRRQRILERVGWKFWRCFASSFYRDPDGVMAELVDAMNSQGIGPLTGIGGRKAVQHLTEHRTATLAPARERLSSAEGPSHPAFLNGTGVAARSKAAIKPGDHIALLFADRKRLTIRLTEDGTEGTRESVSIATPLGQALAGAEEGDEIEVPCADGPPDKALIEAVEAAI